MNKICNVCKQNLDISLFHKDKTRKDGRQGYCKSCARKIKALHYANNKRSYYEALMRKKERRREFIRQAKNKPCTDCNISYPYWIMQFDHIGDDKLFTIGSDKFSWTLEEIIAEIAKCEVVCANCHAHRTFTRLKAIDEENEEKDNGD